MACSLVSITFDRGSFKKYVRCVGGSLKSELKQTGREGGQAYLYVRSVKKIAWFLPEITNKFT